MKRMSKKKKDHQFGKSSKINPISFIYYLREEDDEFGQSSKINCFLGFPAPVASQTKFYFVIRATDPATLSSTLQKHNIYQNQNEKIAKESTYMCKMCQNNTHTLFSRYTLTFKVFAVCQGPGVPLNPILVETAIGSSNPKPCVTCMQQAISSTWRRNKNRK